MSRSDRLPDVNYQPLDLRDQRAKKNFAMSSNNWPYRFLVQKIGVENIDYEDPAPLFSTLVRLAIRIIEQTFFLIFVWSWV